VNSEARAKPANKNNNDTIIVGRCGVVGSTLAFGSIGHVFDSENRLFSHHGASAFSKLRSLAKCLLDDSFRRLLEFTQLATLRGGRIE